MPVLRITRRRLRPSSAYGSSPKSNALPASGGSNPQIVRSNVDLPDPEPPRIATISAGRTLMSTSFTTGSLAEYPHESAWHSTTLGVCVAMRHRPSRRHDAIRDHDEEDAEYDCRRRVSTHALGAAASRQSH